VVVEVTAKDRSNR